MPFEDTVFLKNIDVLSFFNEEQLRRVTPDIERQSYAKGQTVILRGEISSGFCILKKGSATATYKGPKGPVERTLKAGDFFGEITLLADAPSDTAIKAAEDDTVILTIPPEGFKKLLEMAPILKKSLLDKVAASKKSLGL
jgi:CRP-like cAMP-binding protein